MSNLHDTFAFRLPPALLQRLRTVARKENITAGELIRRGLTSELDRLDVLRLARELEGRVDKEGTAA